MRSALQKDERYTERAILLKYILSGYSSENHFIKPNNYKNNYLRRSRWLLEYLKKLFAALLLYDYGPTKSFLNLYATKFFKYFNKIVFFP
jgi:hypothetical protein